MISLFVSGTAFVDLYRDTYPTRPSSSPSESVCTDRGVRLVPGHGSHPALQLPVRVCMYRQRGQTCAGTHIPPGPPALHSGGQRPWLNYSCQVCVYTAHSPPFPTKEMPPIDSLHIKSRLKLCDMQVMSNRGDSPSNTIFAKGATKYVAGSFHSSQLPP